MSSNNGIRNIIFDLGGVILNINYQLTEKAFQNLGLTNFNELYSQARQQHLFDRFEKGITSSSEFRKELMELSSVELSEAQIDAAWNAMLLDLPPGRLQLLEEIKKEYRIFLLSNTNEIHITAYSKYLQKTFGVRDLSHLFEKEYYSYKMGMRKPDVEIFELVLRENDLSPKETLFIDDSAQHLEGAQKAGIKAVLLAKNANIESTIKTILE